MSKLFRGLVAFPLTPASASGVVDVGALAAMVDRLASAQVAAVCLLGSTGIYAYLDRAERSRAVKAALEAAGERVPVIVGIGALRTSWSCELADDAERAGAAGLLMAPVSYTPLTEEEVRQHYLATAASTGLPVCIYNNPSTTRFVFSDDLIAELATVRNIVAVKMPLPEAGGFAAEIARLRIRTGKDFGIGYSGDWGAGDALLAGGDAWFSVVAGLLPKIALALTSAATVGNVPEVKRLNEAFEPLWSLFRRFGSIRVMYEVADKLSLSAGSPPPPILPIGSEAAGAVAAALERLEDVERSLGGSAI